MVRNLALILCAVMAPVGVAQAETMTWVVRNSSGTPAQLNLYSQSRKGHVWPGGGVAYDLPGDRIKTLSITCESEEKICYGAWMVGRSSTYWGAGLGGDAACDHCCGVCGRETTVNLTSGSPAPAAGASDGSVHEFKWTYNAQPSPGVRTWTRDAASRWHEHYPDGHEAKVFDRVTRSDARGCAGSVVSSSSEPDFEVFIPDAGCSRMWVLFRRGGAWNDMGAMFAVK